MKADREREYAQWLASVVVGGGVVTTAEIYDLANGWRVAIGNVEGKMLAMPHGRAKGFAEKCMARIATEMPDADDAEPIRALMRDVIACADLCRMNNRDRVVPDGYVDLLEPEGRG